MNPQTITQNVTLEVESCYKCGIPFAAPEWFIRQRRTDGELFYCPNGHGQHYTKTELMRLQEKLAEQTRQATAMAERARLAELSEDKMRKEAERLKKRAKAGVCSCCNRTFQNLAQHMKTKHKDA